MEIVDLRDKTAQYGVREALEKAIPLMSGDMTVRVRNIVLLDSDCRGGKDGAARCVSVPGTRKADVVLYFRHYDEIPKEIAGNRVFLGLLAVQSLVHELLRRRARAHPAQRASGCGRGRGPADNGAAEHVMNILTNIYPLAEHRDEYAQIRAMGRKIGFLLDV